MSWVAGVDGCPGGWIAVFVDLEGRSAPEFAVERAFSGIAGHARRPALIAVDMPIGLPATVGPGGRRPERELRPLLGARQSSVFSVPSRAAVEARDYAACCAAALATSDPPRKVSKQSFFLFPKIRELDTLLRAEAELAGRVFESHPEAVFMLLKGRPLDEPKKVKSRPWPAGLAERRTLLRKAGLPDPLLEAAPPRGAAQDDLLDACACAVAAMRIARGQARSFPETPERDAHGLLMAIRA